MPEPEYVVIRYRRHTNHTVHAFLTLCTCFVWLPVWLGIAAWNAWGPESTIYIEHQPPRGTP
jgi:hypothetical protein